MNPLKLLCAGVLALSWLGGAQARVETRSSGSVRVTVQTVYRAPIRPTPIRPTPIRVVPARVQTVRSEWRAAGVQVGTARKVNARAVQTVQNPGSRPQSRLVTVRGGCGRSSVLPLAFRRAYRLGSAPACGSSVRTVQVRLSPGSGVRVWQAQQVQPRTYTLRLYRVFPDGRSVATSQLRRTTVYAVQPLTSLVRFTLSS